MLNIDHQTIDNALKRVEEASSSSISSSIENLYENENDSFDYNEQNYENDDREENTTVLQEDRLDKLEGQIKKLVSMKYILQNQIKNGLLTSPADYFLLNYLFNRKNPKRAPGAYR